MTCQNEPPGSKWIEGGNKSAEGLDPMRRVVRKSVPLRVEAVPLDCVLYVLKQGWFKSVVDLHVVTQVANRN